jgi:hypothetical protein
MYCPTVGLILGNKTSKKVSVLIRSPPFHLFSLSARGRAPPSADHPSARSRTGTWSRGLIGGRGPPCPPPRSPGRIRWLDRASAPASRRACSCPRPRSLGFIRSAQTASDRGASASARPRNLTGRSASAPASRSARACACPLSLGFIRSAQTAGSRSARARACA